MAGTSTGSGSASAAAEPVVAFLGDDRTLGTGAWGDSDPPSELAPLAAAIKSAVTKVGGSYVALADPIKGQLNFMANAADPDDAGYAAIASALEHTSAR